MKNLFRCLTAVFFALCLGLCAYADIVRPPIVGSSYLTLILVIGIIIIALAILIIVLRKRKK